MQRLFCTCTRNGHTGWRGLPVLARDVDGLQDGMSEPGLRWQRASHRAGITPLQACPPGPCRSGSPRAVADQPAAWICTRDPDCRAFESAQQCFRENGDLALASGLFTKFCQAGPCRPGPWRAVSFTAHHAPAYAERILQPACFGSIAGFMGMRLGPASPGQQGGPAGHTP